MEKDGDIMSKASKKHEPIKPHRTTLQTIALVYVIIHGFIFWLTANSIPVEDAANALVSQSIAVGLIGIASLASVVAGIAMWFWKRWGIYLYVVATFVLAGAVLLRTGSMIMLFGALIPMFIVAYILYPALKHFK